MISDISIIFMISEYFFFQSFVALKIIKLSYLNRREQRRALNNHNNLLQAVRWGKLINIRPISAHSANSELFWQILRGQGRFGQLPDERKRAPDAKNRLFCGRMGISTGKQMDQFTRHSSRRASPPPVQRNLWGHLHRCWQQRRTCKYSNETDFDESLIRLWGTNYVPISYVPDLLRFMMTHLLNTCWEPRKSLKAKFGRVRPGRNIFDTVETSALPVRAILA